MTCAVRKLQDSMGEFKGKPSLTLRAAFLLRLAREGRKQESTRSQQAHKGYDAQENVHGGQLEPGWILAPDDVRCRRVRLGKSLVYFQFH